DADPQARLSAGGLGRSPDGLRHDARPPRRGLTPALRARPQLRGRLGGPLHQPRRRIHGRSGARRGWSAEVLSAAGAARGGRFKGRLRAASPIPALPYASLPVALTDEQRTMLQLLLEGGQGYADIGSLLGISADEVRSRARS